MKKNKKGFEAVELVIIIVIMALVSALLIPAFQKVASVREMKKATERIEIEVYGDFSHEFSLGDVIGYSDRLREKQLHKDFNAIEFESELRSDLRDVLASMAEESNRPETHLIEYEKIKQKNHVEQLEARIKALEKKFWELENRRN